MPVTSPDGSSLYLYWWVCALKKDFSANIYVRWEQSLHGYRYCRFPFSIDRSNCIPKCRACEIKCPVDYQIKRDQKNAGECIHCMQCMDVCPKQNIHLGSGKKLKGNEIFIILLKLVLFIGVCIFAQSL